MSNASMEEGGGGGLWYGLLGNVVDPIMFQYWKGLLLMAPNMYTFTFELMKAQLAGALGNLQASCGGNGKIVSIFFDGFEYTEEGTSGIAALLDKGINVNSMMFPSVLYRHYYMLHTQPTIHPRIAFVWNVNGKCMTTAPSFIPPMDCFRTKREAKKYHNHLTDLRHLDGINKIPIGAIIYLFQEKDEGCWPAGFYKMEVVSKFGPSIVSLNGVMAPFRGSVIVIDSSTENTTSMLQAAMGGMSSSQHSSNISSFSIPPPSSTHSSRISAAGGSGSGESFVAAPPQYVSASVIIPPPPPPKRSAANLSMSVNVSSITMNTSMMQNHQQQQQKGGEGTMLLSASFMEEGDEEEEGEGGSSSKERSLKKPRSVTPGINDPWDVEYLKASGLLLSPSPVPLQKGHLLPSPPPSTPASDSKRPRRVSACRASTAWASLSSPRAKK